MKKLLLAATLLLTLFAQGQQLENKVIEIDKAEGNYSHESAPARIIKEVHIEESIDNFYRDINVDKVELAEALENTGNVIAEAKAKNDQDTFRVWSYKKERLEKFKATVDKKAVDYRILQHTYYVNNPKPGYTPITVTSYYFFDGNNNFIGKIGSQDFIAAKQKYTNSITHAYEFIMFGFKHKDTIGR